MFMKTNCRYILCLTLFFLTMTRITKAQQDTGRIRVIMIGAHPDDCDLKGGGTAAYFSSLGCAVKFVSVTNGDAGHQTGKGVLLAKRRLEEAREAAKRLGV